MPQVILLSRSTEIKRQEPSVPTVMLVRKNFRYKPVSILASFVLKFMFLEQLLYYIPIEIYT